ncbi:hypothetical protein MNBD_NITROSPINAE04-2539 [hydrothermal vent metagenome]|uniref:Type I restriction enzyme R protein N-terminal domain-containing protein n=1 Tax=hydrothermal vent metagenome TaxID=652676 RepID=A0A3B1BRN7_9ZZZZ
MSTIPKKVSERLVKGIKQFQPVLNAARSRDVNEADTATIVTDILSDLFGYDKYSEITSEYAIKGTYCDLAVKIGAEIRLLIEVKAIGLDLNKNHLKQVCDYAANEGVDWVALTNGISWKIYKLIFSKPIDKEFVLEFDFTQLNHKSKDSLEDLYLLTREGRSKSALKEYYVQRQTMNKFSIGAVILSEPVLSVIRRELKKLSPKTKIQNEDIKEIITQEVLKREVVEGEKASEAKKELIKAGRRQKRAKQKVKAKEAPVISENEDDSKEGVVASPPDESGSTPM